MSPSSTGRADSYERIKGWYHRRFKVLAPYLPELIAMRRGLRTAIQLSLEPAALDLHLRSIEEFCARSGLSLRRYDSGPTTRLLLSSGELGWIDHQDVDSLGRLFGYPRCCVEAYDARRDWAHPLFNHLAELFAAGETFDPAINLLLRTSPFHLIKHFPCSPRCQATLRQAAALRDALRAENRPLAEHVERFCCGPAFYTDIGAVGIMLEGRRVDGAVRYSGWHHEYHPAGVLDLSTRNRPEDCALFDELLAAIAEGDELRLEQRRLYIVRRGKRLRTFAQPEHLRWKIVQFS